MTYPQSGSGYGQSGGQDPYAQQYGQQYAQGAQQGQQYGQQQYGQADASQQQYGQQQYGQADASQQQYAQQQYGYGQQQFAAPKPPSQGLPANTTVGLAGGVAGLGILMLFLGFLAGYSVEDHSIAVFQVAFGVPWALLGVAGVLSAFTFIIGAGKELVAVIASLTVVSALAAIFQFATEGIFEGLADTGIGAILLLVFSILAAVAAVLWLLIEGGQVKVAPAVPAAAQAEAAPVAAGYDYGQQAQQQAADYGQQAQQAPVAGYGQAAEQAGAHQSGAHQTYGAAADAATSYAGSNAPTSYTPAPGTPAADENGATTAFVKPDADSGENKI